MHLQTLCDNVNNMNTLDKEGAYSSSFVYSIHHVCIYITESVLHIYMHTCGYDVPLSYPIYNRRMKWWQCLHASDSKTMKHNPSLNMESLPLYDPPA